MAAINPRLPLSALNDAVRSHTSPTAAAATTSPSEMNQPWLTSAHEVRDTEREEAIGPLIQQRHFVRAFLGWIQILFKH